MKYDLVIIGGGPGGLSAAVEARQNGIEKILIIERKRIRWNFTTMYPQRFLVYMNLKKNYLRRNNMLKDLWTKYLKWN